MRVLAGKYNFKVRGTRVLVDIYGAVDLKRRLVVSFDREDGLDYSGVSRYILFTSVFITRVLTAASQKIVFNPSYGLFEHPTYDNYTLQIKPASDRSSYFKFIGRCLDLAIFHRQFLHAYFMPSSYKTVLGKQVVPTDLKSVDELYGVRIECCEYMPLLYHS